MKINFTKKEYRALLDLLKISDWVLHAHTFGDRKETKNHALLIQKLLSSASVMGFEDLIVKDKNTGKYYPTQKYEGDDGYMQHIEFHDNNVFWEELSYKLAMRDLIDQEGESQVEKMDPFDRGTKVIQLEEWYIEEFGRNGIQNLKASSKPVKKPH
jgi:hypothetical protein